MERECDKCKKIKKDIRYSEKLDQYFCNWCYRKHIWKPNLIICKRCERNMPAHAKGLCNGCYNSVFHINKVKLHNAKKYHNIDAELYKKVTKECIICGFNKIVDLHHIDMDHENNLEENLLGLCPNHHKMVHHRSHQKEVFQILQEKGFKTPEVYKDDAFFKS